MSYMFRNFGRFGSNILNIDFTDFKTPALRSMFHMFDGYEANKLKVVDLSSFDTSKVTNMTYAFSSNESNAGNRYIDTIYASDSYVIDGVDSSAVSFGHSRNLTGGAGTVWSTAHITAEYARIDDPDNGKPGYFTLKNARYIRYNGNGADNAEPYGTMTSHYLTNTGSLKVNAYTRDGYTFVGWNTEADGSGTSYSDEQLMSDLTESKTPLTLYAQWE